MNDKQTTDKPMFNKGLKGVIANETGLSDVRGEEGRLLYCGYEIEDLVDLRSVILFEISERLSISFPFCCIMRLFCLAI